MNTYIAYYNSPIGKLTLASDGDFLIGVWFDGQKYDRLNLSKDVTIKELPIFELTKKWLDIYFKGENPDFIPPIKLTGSDFRKMVLEILLTISFGQTITYKDIAKIVAIKRNIKKMSAQAVGGAVGHNPLSIIVPCHRVIGSDNNLIGYAGGLDKKIYLLKNEGIIIDDDNLAVLNKSL